MSEEKLNETEQEAQVESVEGVVEQPELTIEEELAAAHAEIEALKNEVKDVQLRGQAEMQNVRRRSTLDVEHARKFGAEKLAKELLPVKDSLDMGLDAAAAADANIDSLKEGMDLTAKQLASAMEKIGITEINPLGEAFNPDQHEAMLMQPSSDVEPNSVLTVFRRGYMLNGRVMRPAQVIVASAPA